MSISLEWRKQRLDSTSRPILDRAVTDLNRKLGAKLRIVKLSSGKLVACHVEDLWFCRVSDDGDPPCVWTVAVDTRPEQRTLLPTEDPADFDECCDLLGFRTEGQQREFRDFLIPDHDQTEASTAQGAS